MADPKIKYDIEAVVKGDADAEQLAKALRDVGDALEGDLKTSATEAAQALDALGSKQRALDAFVGLKREATAVGAALEGARAEATRLAQELPKATANTQALQAAQKTAAGALRTAEDSLASQRASLKALQTETQGAARKSDEYRASVIALRTGIKESVAAVREKRDALTGARKAASDAARDETNLGKAFEQSKVSAKNLKAELQSKTLAVQQSRAAMKAMGLSTTSLTQQQRSLQTAVEQVRTEVAALAPAYQQAAVASTRSTQVQAQNQRTLREGMQSIGAQLQRIQQIATIAVGGTYFGGLIKGVAATADEFKNLEARIRIVTGEGEQFQQAFDGVAQVALRTNSALDETGTLFTRLARAGQEAGKSAQQAQQDALGLTETINQSIQLSGGSAESTKAAIVQLIQGLQSGVLRGEEFNSVMEQAPRLAQTMANGLGVTTGELRKLANQGALTSEVVMKALQGQADAVAQEFGKLPPTVGRALQNLSSQWTLYVGSADAGLLSSENAAKVIDALAGNLDTLVNTLQTAGKLWAAIKIAGLASDFAAWAAKTISATTAVEANTVAVAGNTAAQRANATAVAAAAAAQAANATATTANTVAKSKSASAWGSVASFAGAATKATKGATAATAANTAAVAAKTGRLGLLGAALRGVTGILGGPVGLAATVVMFSGEIKRGIESVTDWALSFTAAGRELKAFEEQQKSELEQQKKAKAAREAAAESQRRMAAAMQEARDRSFELSKAATGLIAQFDKMRTDGTAAGDAIAKIGKDFDLSNVQGIRDASAVLDKLVADGKLSADEFAAAWAQALQGKDLAQFEVTARAAFSGAAREGERVAQMLDATMREAVRRTGLDFDNLQGKIGAASRSALNDLEVVINSLGRLQEMGVDTGQVLQASFASAIDTADSQAAIDAVTARVEQLRSKLGDTVANGLLDQARQKAEALADAMDKATPGINSVREAMQALGVTSDATLKDVAAKSKTAFDALASSGKASARELADGFKKAAADAIAANNGIAPSWVTAQAAVRGYKVEVDAAGRASLVAMDGAKGAADRAAGGFREMASQARSAKEALQAMGIEADQVSEKVAGLVAQGQMLAAAFQQRQDNRNSEIEQNKYMNRGTTNSLDLVPTFNSREEAEAWKQKWLEQYFKKDNFMNKGQLGYYMKDMTMFEFEGELKSLELREAMEAAKKKTDAGGSKPDAGGTPGTGSGSGPAPGGQSIDRTVNVYIGNSQAYSIPTNQQGQQSVEAMGREVMRQLEDAKWMSGR